MLHICAALRSARNSIMLACNIRPSTGHLSQPCGTPAGARARAGVEPAICLSKLCRPGDIYTPQQRQVDGQQQWITKYQVHGMCLEQDCAQNYARQVQQGMRRPDTTIEQAGRQAGRGACPTWHQLRDVFKSLLHTFHAYLSALCLLIAY